MFQTADEVIQAYGLVPHPEGGHYREAYRSESSVGVPPGYPGPRAALTAIYFLLARGEFSAFHRVRSDEAWIHLAGAPLELVLLGRRCRLLRIGAADRGEGPLAVVPGGRLQAARCLGAWSLATCLVAPGFDFADFDLPSRRKLLERYPDQAEWILRFTR
ncbi:MAG: hypothetical protein Kow0092_18280 [Deferrisomatales bacterium]